MERPTFTVICPTYNSSKFIEKTLLSVLSQDRLPDELIISDDGSEDDTINILDNFFKNRETNLRIQILKNNHHGPGFARNIGIKNATCSWIAFLDSDDLWIENKLKNIENTILSYPKVNFICHDEIWIERNGNKKLISYGSNYAYHSSLIHQLYKKNLFSTSAVVCKKNLLLKHGLFDENLMSAQDYELWLRLAENINPFFLNEVCGHYIKRIGNISSKNQLNRLRNDLKIAFRYKKKVNLYFFLIKLVRIFASHLKQIII